MSTNCGAGQEGWCAWSHSVGVDSFLLLVQVPQEVKNLILDFGPTLGFDAWLVRALIMVYSVRTIMGKKKCWCHSCAGKSFFAPEHCCFLSFRFVCLIPPYNGAWYAFGLWRFPARFWMAMWLRMRAKLACSCAVCARSSSPLMFAIGSNFVVLA